MKGTVNSRPRRFERAAHGHQRRCAWQRAAHGSEFSERIIGCLPVMVMDAMAVGTALRERLGAAPSFVAFEGYDTVAVLADVLRSHGPDRARIAASWPHVGVEGTRGRIRFSRMPGISVWQWDRTPIQVVDRDPAEPDRFRGLHTG